MRDEAEHQAESAVLEFGARRCPDAEGVTDRRLRAAIAVCALAGVPVALLGLAAYLAIFATALSSRVEAAAIGAAIAIAGLAFAIYLIVIQVAVIDAICQWCLASDAILAVLAVLSLERLRRLAGSPQESS